MFGVTKKKSVTVENLLNTVASIQSTSTDSKRVFSIDGNFCIKLRSSMKYDLLNPLVCLKYYLIKKRDL